MAKNSRRQKIHLLPCAFLVSRHGIFNAHVPMCIFCVLTLCMFEYFLVHLPCNLCFKVCVFLRVWHLCLAQAYFFYALNLGTCVLCRCIYFTRVWKSDLYVYCGCISYPRIVHFFWNAHFWTAPVEAKITVLSCKCILATKNKFS